MSLLFGAIGKVPEPSKAHDPRTLQLPKESLAVSIDFARLTPNQKKNVNTFVETADAKLSDDEIQEKARTELGDEIDAYAKNLGIEVINNFLKAIVAAVRALNYVAKL